MPIITNKEDVLAIYQQAALKGRVIPCFGTENLVTTEAILSAAMEYGEGIGEPDIPITIAITNQYAQRSQSSYYTQTRNWKVGLQLFLADLIVLAGEHSPFHNLRIMIHLDHIQHDLDSELLESDLSPFSSIMFDASTLPFEKNMEATAQFVKEKGAGILVEGACDEITDASGQEKNELTTPEHAEIYMARTGVDLMVANVGTEHRAKAANLKYDAGLAQRIKERIGTKIVLHGCSSVAKKDLKHLFDHGICKVNVWTALERDTTPVLFHQMLKDAAAMIGPENVDKMIKGNKLTSYSRGRSGLSIKHFTVFYRNRIVFREMKKIIMGYLQLWM